MWSLHWRTPGREKISKICAKKFSLTLRSEQVFSVYLHVKEKVCIPSCQCSKGWYLYVYLIQSREFWPRFFFFFLLLCIHAYMRRGRAAFSKLLPGQRVIFSRTWAAGKASPQRQFLAVETLFWLGRNRAARSPGPLCVLPAFAPAHQRAPHPLPCSPGPEPSL